MEKSSIFRSYIMENRSPYLIGFTLLSMSCLLQLLIPVFMGAFTDQLRDQTLTYKEAVQYAWWIVGVGLGVALFRSVSRTFLFRLARVLEMKVRGQLFAHWERLSAHYFNNRRIGDLMSHAISDVGVVREVTMGGIFMVMEAFVLISVTVAAMVWTIDPWLTLFTMLPLPLLSILAYRFNRRIQQQSAEVQEAVATLTSRVQEFVAGIRVVKAYVQEKAEQQLFTGDNEDAVKKNLVFAKSNALFGALSSAVVGLSFLVSVVFGGILVLRETISLGDFVAFNTYLALLMGPIENLGKVVNNIQRGRASEDRLLAILNTEPDVADDELAVEGIEALEGGIEIRGLTFTYPGAKKPALQDIDLNVPKGTSLAIVGRVGSGKSTLINLLVRLYNPPKGTVFIDGYHIHEIPLKTLRGEIGIVPQDPFLFSSTIRDNIGFDPQPHTEDEVLAAAKLAQVYDNIVEFPEGFDTTLGERGVSLSGGQRQRVSIARAVIKQPSVLIFDDSLSAVDTITEDRILEGLQKVMKDRTTIIIGHRISSVRHADQIIVLEEGRIVERGSHEELLMDDGLYAELYRKQQLDELAEGYSMDAADEDSLLTVEAQLAAALQPEKRGGAAG